MTSFAYQPSFDGVGDRSNYDASFGNIGGYNVANNAGAGGASTSGSSNIQGQQYPTDAQGIFLDPNPQIINKPAPEGVQTHVQNIQVRYLRPRPSPPPGPRIIVEVNQPLPPLPKPLQVRQPAPAAVQKPPIILRERPPPKLPVIPPERITRPVPPPPPPPRSVIIERMAPSPSTPPDIIIERWVPRDPPPVRETKVIAAPPQEPYPPPRNVIIQYTPAQLRILRKFQRLGVTDADEDAYIQQYGPQLLDSGTLVQQARSLGVIEDISPPGNTGGIGYGVASNRVGGETGIEGGFDAPSSNFSSTNQ